MHEKEKNAYTLQNVIKTVNVKKRTEKKLKEISEVDQGYRFYRFQRERSIFFKQNEEKSEMRNKNNKMKYHMIFVCGFSGQFNRNRQNLLELVVRNTT